MNAVGNSMITDLGSGRCTVTGDLTLATVGQLWRQLQASSLLHTASSADLGQVAQSDSAGLAMLVAWRAACRAKGVDLGMTAVPERLKALARLTDADTILAG